MRGLDERLQLDTPKAGWGFALVPEWVGASSVRWVVTAPNTSEGRSSKRRLEAISWVEGQARDLGFLVVGGRWA